MNRTSIKDYSEIIATVQKYVDGCNEGKSEVMKPAFDAGAVMYSVNADGTVAAQGSIENLYAIVDQVGPDHGGSARVDVIESTPPPPSCAWSSRTGTACPSSTTTPW